MDDVDVTRLATPDCATGVIVVDFPASPSSLLAPLLGFFEFGRVSECCEFGLADDGGNGRTGLGERLRMCFFPLVLAN